MIKGILPSEVNSKIRVLTCINLHSVCEIPDEWLLSSDYRFLYLLKKGVYIDLICNCIVLIARTQFAICQQCCHTNIYMQNIFETFF